MAFKLAALIQIIDAFLSMPNAANTMASLTGASAKNKREIYERFLLDPRKFTSAELKSAFPRTTLNDNLNALLRLGLLRREKLDGKSHVYELTWHGRSLGKEIMKNGKLHWASNQPVVQPATLQKQASKNTKPRKYPQQPVDVYSLKVTAADNAKTRSVPYDAPNKEKHQTPNLKLEHQY
jgi:DNA-binding HxlR family transcriptional regulator